MSEKRKKATPKGKPSSQEKDIDDTEYKPKGTKSRGKQTKKAATQSSEDTDSGATPTLKKSSSNVSDVGEIDFSSSATTKDGKLVILLYGSIGV